LIEKVLAKLGTDRIVVLSEQQRREINEEFGVGNPRQFSIIPLGIDLSVFADWRERGQSFRAEFELGADDILVGIVGRLTEVKNHKLFLRAAALFKNEFAKAGSTVRFVIVGDGALRKALERQAQSLGVTDDVIFTGTRRDLQNVYPALDIVALTSRNEGTPLTLIEAMANARPVISTAVGGVVDLLGEPLVSSGSGPEDPPGQPAWVGGSDRVSFEVCQRGISVSPDDAHGFAAGLARLVDDATLRRETGARGLQFVTRQYSKERLLKDIEALYTRLLQGGPSPSL
jgi:glycosyltransferase involved in cell wall biosynthesis